MYIYNCICTVGVRIMCISNPNSQVMSERKTSRRDATRRDQTIRKRDLGPGWIRFEIRPRVRNVSLTHYLLSRDYAGEERWVDWGGGVEGEIRNLLKPVLNARIRTDTDDTERVNADRLLTRLISDYLYSTRWWWSIIGVWDRRPNDKPKRARKIDYDKCYEAVSMAN